MLINKKARSSSKARYENAKSQSNNTTNYNNTRAASQQRTKRRKKSKDKISRSSNYVKDIYGWDDTKEDGNKSSSSQYYFQPRPSSTLINYQKQNESIYKHHIGIGSAATGSQSVLPLSMQKKHS